MGNVLLLQAVALLLVVFVSGSVKGVEAAYSALAGGASYLLPSFIMMLVLKFFKPYPKLAGYGFFLGEGLRIVLSMAIMLVVFFMWYQELHFIPFLLGLLVVSHIVFLVFWKVNRYGK